MQADQPEKPETWEVVRESIIGGNAFLDTPFGGRRLTYADHTASGRAVTFIEDQLRSALELYGNTHTEDDATGSITSERLREAEALIKRLVNAGPGHKIVTVGSGTTAAVHQLQQILGIYLAAGRAGLVPEAPGRQPAQGATARLSLRAWRQSRPVVFVGPYEHHSNEVSWRECFAEVVEIELDGCGLLDIERPSQESWQTRGTPGGGRSARSPPRRTSPG